MEKFEPGDVVRYNCDGPKMIFVRYDKADSEFAKCQWFNVNHELKIDTFIAKALIKVTK